MSQQQRPKNSENSVDLAVVGGGLAGLAAAALVASAGKRVVVIERAEHPGGRARSLVEDGFVFNQGPHALYRKAAGIAVLKKLGIAPRGALPGNGFVTTCAIRSSSLTTWSRISSWRRSSSATRSTERSQRSWRRSTRSTPPWTTSTVRMETAAPTVHAPGGLQGQRRMGIGMQCV